MRSKFRLGGRIYQVDGKKLFGERIFPESKLRYLYKRHRFQGGGGLFSAIYASINVAMAIMHNLYNLPQIVVEFLRKLQKVYLFI